MLVDGEKEKIGVGFVVGKLDPLAKQQNHGSNTTKSHKNQQNAKKIVRLFLVGIFEIGQEQTKLS